MRERNSRARRRVLAFTRRARFSGAHDLRLMLFGAVLRYVLTGLRLTGRLVPLLDQARQHPCTHAPILARGDEDALCSRVGEKGDRVRAVPMFSILLFIPVFILLAILSMIMMMLLDLRLQQACRLGGTGLNCKLSHVR